MERQARLTGDGAPQLWVVLNEAVIRRLVGDRATMHEQLVKLSEQSNAPNITLQVLPSPLARTRPWTQPSPC